VAESGVARDLLQALAKDVAALLGFPLQNTAMLLLSLAMERRRELWRSELSATELVSASGRSVAISRTTAGLLRADALPVSGLRQPAVMRVRGKFSKDDPWTSRNLRRGDPIAVLLERATGGARGHGHDLLLPARYGESFELTVPVGAYRIAAYALDRYGGSVLDNRSVRALGAQRLGSGQTLLGRERIGLRQRPSLRSVGYTPTSWPRELRIDLPQQRERIRVAPPVARSRPPATRAPARRPAGGSAADERCTAVAGPGRCPQRRVRGHKLCERHLRQAVRYGSVRHHAKDTDVTVHCNHEKSNGRRCGRPAVVVGAGAPVRALCAKHATSGDVSGAAGHCTFATPDGRRCGREAVVVRLSPYLAYCGRHLAGHELEPGRCRARTSSGTRCKNAVASGHPELCTAHDRAAGRVRHYADDDIWYE
jgi:hypothetical protein